MISSGFFMYILNQNLYFPALDKTHPSGIIAIGGDLSPNRLLLAYRNGIFPWFEDNEPITWWSPERRMVCFLKDYKVSKSLRNLCNRNIFKVTYNQCFSQVIQCCSEIERPGQNGTWITEQMQQAYIEMHRLGYAKSVEVWQDNELVGGLYGIDLGTVFCGESMFSKVSNASKVGFATLAKKLKEKKYTLIDGQIYNDYLAQLGFEEISRNVFEQYLKNSL